MKNDFGVGSAAVSLAAALTEERKRKLESLNHDWLELGVTPDDRVLFICSKCILHVNVERKGAWKSITNAAKNGRTYPSEPSPTLEELSRDDLTEQCKKQGAA